jgi:uncharacterized protein (TIGR02001 family)
MSIRTASLGVASLLAAAVFAAPAFADGMPSHGRIGSSAPESRTCSTTGNVGLTSDYVFRGISQSAEDPAIQGGVDFTCGRFYGGVWGSSIDFGGDASAEVDIYGGYKFSTGPLNWDLGLIYYAYSGHFADDADFVELKAGASGAIWKGGTLGGTVFYSPEGQFNTGDVWTFEGSFSQALPKVGMFSPTFSATLGHSDFTDFDDLSYTYWNVGLTLGFLERWSVDLRYWDTDLDNCSGHYFSCDSRIVGSIKYTF